MASLDAEAEAIVAVIGTVTAMTVTVIMTAPTTVVHLHQDTPDPRHQEDGMRPEAQTATCRPTEAAAMTIRDVAVALLRTDDPQFDHVRHPDGVNAATLAQMSPVLLRRTETERAAMISTNPPAKMLVVDHAHNRLGRIAEGPQSTTTRVGTPHRARVPQLVETDMAPHARDRRRIKAGGLQLQKTSSPAPTERQTHTACRLPAGTTLPTAIADAAQMRSQPMAVL